MNAQLFCHENRIVHVVVKLLGNLFVGMNRVAMAAEGTDFQARLFDGLHKLLELGFVVQQNARITVVLAGIAAAANFYHLGAQGFKIGQSFLQGSLADHIGQYA